uniref:FERM domain-containing protein n=1 Tax=Globodera rostochiensis TaxID=31243 RepID=A0A914H0I2_GLORO
MQKPVTSKIPHGVGCPPPPGMDPRKGKGKLMCIKVRMLDDSVGVFHLGHKAAGQALFDEVCRYLNLLESDYFGLEFIDSFGNRCWLDKDKSILRQILVAQSDARFLFIVKFYTPNPAELEEEYTRYLFALQIRRDLSRGELLCTNENTAALLVALIVQSECGDFSPLDYSDANVYLAGTHFVPQQTHAFAQAVMEQHRRLIGMEPAEADFTLLETARRCDFYGLRLHPARDIEGTEVALAVAHMGIKVFHQMNCVTTFSWAKVRKFSFKRKRLMIKVHPDSFQFYKETIEFSFENRDDCKNFWKKCVEHHSFFRCAEPVVVAGAKGGEDGGRKQYQQQQQHHHHLFSRGSNFQYRGRTQKQLIDYVREHRKRREPFQRPLRRGNAMFTGGGTNFGTNSLGRAAQFLVSDRMVKDSEAMGNGQHRNGRVEEANFACTFPSLCAQHQQQQKLQNGGKGRPKSALLSDEKRNQKSSKQQQQQPQLSMQNSYHAGMAQRQENGIATEAHQNSVAAAETMALFHQHMDPMCMSMPNVLLTTDSPIGPAAMAKLSPPSAANASASFLHSAHKSVSGENFHYAAELREDNLSEDLFILGSYRVGGRGAFQRLAPQQKDGAASSTASSQSDIVSAVHSPVDPRVYQTTFTTKRVGNVIMKRVMNNDITPTPTAVGADVKPSAHRRPPLTSRSAVDAGDPGDESDSLASSSAAFSDYSLAATAPPSACYPPTTTVSMAPSFARSTATGRIRCTPPPAVATQQQQSIPVTIANQVLLPVHLRNEVPVPIDAPPPVNIVSRPGQQQQPAMSTKTTIIRPVLLPSPATTTNSLDKGRTALSSSSTIASAGSSCIIVKRRPSSSTASSASTPTQSTTAQRRPIVVAKASPSPPPPILHINGGLEAAKTKQNRQKEDTTNRESDGNSSCDGGRGDGPMPGCVIQRQDLVITAGGIALRGAKSGESVVEKPKVLPKPDLGTLMGLIGQHKQSETNRNLVDPLESILKDVRSMNEALDGLESPTGSGGTPRSQSSQKVGAVAATAADEQQQAVSGAVSSRRRPPDAISVESDEWPSVRTLHLFNNGNNRVPYTLTVRDLSGGQTTTIGDGFSEEKQREGAALASSAFSTGGCGRSRNATTPEGPLAMIGGAALRHKSLELVQRKRLPAQGAFSSQDHSITATSPEAGNVFEYVVSQRRRSASSDRLIVAHSTQCQQNRRVSNRRQTQPVEMVGKWTTGRGEDIQISADLTEEKDEKIVGILPSEVLGIPTQNSEDSASSASTQQQQRLPQQLLETDF